MGNTKVTHDVAFQSWLYSKAGQGSVSGQEEVNNATCCHENNAHHIVRPGPRVSGYRWCLFLCSTLQTSCLTNLRPADTGRCSNHFRHSVKKTRLNVKIAAKTSYQAMTTTLLMRSYSNFQTVWGCCMNRSTITFIP